MWCLTRKWRKWWWLDEKAQDYTDYTLQLCRPKWLKCNTQQCFRNIDISKPYFYCIVPKGFLEQSARGCVGFRHQVPALPSLTVALSPYLAFRWGCSGFFHALWGQWLASSSRHIWQFGPYSHATLETFFRFLRGMTLRIMKKWYGDALRSQAK